MTPPVDPLIGPRFALRGRVVTMNASHKVLEDATVYIEGGRIAALVAADDNPPAALADVVVRDTSGTIYPGLIDLHNHLSYNVLPLWRVPERFVNRDRWSSPYPAYRKLVSGPMKVLGETPGYVEAIVRYVECKLLVGGVTTSQGIKLYSNAGIQKYYRGLVRNVEQTDDAALPEAAARIPDLEAGSASRFFEHLKKQSRLLLHLAEGVDERAHRAFEMLKLPNNKWAITDALTGIHCVALTRDDFDRMASAGASMVWSPLSNLLLYGRTAKIAEARKAGVRIALGSDWSTSGSKSLLWELKVARLAAPDSVTDRQLVEMATTNPARILRWEREVGSIAKGKRADLLVIAGANGDVYEHLLGTDDTDVALIVINGVARYGPAATLKKLGAPVASLESLKVGGKSRALYLSQETADPVVGALTLAEARDRLTDGLARLAELAKELEHPPPQALALDMAERWSLVLDHDDPAGSAQRLKLPGAPETVIPMAPAVPLSQILEPLPLDPLTVSDDEGFNDDIHAQTNLPEEVKLGLAAGA